MNTISWILLAILLLFTLAGFARGFIQTLFSMLGGILAFIIAISFAGPTAELLKSNTTVDDNMTQSIEQKLNEKSPLFSTVLTEENVQTVLNEALENSGIPAFLSTPIANAVSQTPALATGKTPAQMIAQPVIHLAMLGISFFGLWIITFLALLIVKFLLKSLFAQKHLKKLDHILGLCLGAVQGTFLIAIFFAFLSLLSSMEWVQPLIIQIQTGIFGFAYDGVVSLLGNVLDLQKIFQSLFAR